MRQIRPGEVLIKEFLNPLKMSADALPFSWKILVQCINVLAAENMGGSVMKWLYIYLIIFERQHSSDYTFKQHII